MPAFNYNPNDTSAGFPVYPKGTYEITLGEPKPFYRTGKGNKADNYGVGYLGRITETDDPKYLNKKYMVNCYQHNEESKSMGKLVQMAAYGYRKEQEKEFDAMAINLDWSFNTDDGSYGDGWAGMKGQVIVVDLDTTINQETNDQQQKQVNVRPLVAA